MQLIINNTLKQPLTLPLNYNYIIQSAIYSLLQSSSGYSNFLHNQGYSSEKRQYRLFTFGMLKGNYTISDGKITFHNNVELEIRSPEAIFISTLKKSIEENGINYGGTLVAPADIDVKIKDTEVEDTEIKIIMNSPLVLYSTDVETKKTQFYNPLDADFVQRVNTNLKNKYRAYSGIELEDEIDIEVICVGIKDKVVTKYKGFYITGWKGEFRLSGNRKLLDFLYQVGLGCKNSQGFGMFDIY